MHLHYVSHSPSTNEEFVARRNELICEHRDQRAVGGSDLCKILNLAYSSPYKELPIYRAHPALPERSPPNQYMLDGTRYEFCARVLWSVLHPEQPLLFDVTRTMKDGDIRFLVSTDGLLLHGDRTAVFEVKTLARQDEEAFTQLNQSMPYGIPLKYVPQLELYCRAYCRTAAVMMFLMPGVGDNREVYERILDNPLEMLQTLTKEQVRKLCFTRVYRQPSLDMWMLIVRELQLFFEYVRAPDVKVSSATRVFTTRAAMEQKMLAQMRRYNNLMWMNSEDYDPSIKSLLI